MRLGMSPDPSINKAKSIFTTETQRTQRKYSQEGHEDKEPSVLTRDKILCCLIFTFAALL
jgi:hypothetical protein